VSDPVPSSRAGRLALRLALAGAAVAACMALAPLHAEAASTRYAAPEGTGASPCLQAEPCDLETAVESGPGGIQSGDTILLAPGTYHPTASLEVFFPVTLSGEPGKAAPLIEVTAEFGLFMWEPSIVRDLRIHAAAGTASGFVMFGQGTAERIESTGEANNGCVVETATLRDVLCSSVTAGEEGEGIVVFEAGSAPTLFEPKLFNVTAVGGRVGLFVGTNEASAVRLSGVNAIISGGEDDVVARAFATTSESRVDLSHSNFSEVLLEGVHAEVTAPTSAGNQTAEPLFVDAAAGDYAEAEGSPTRGAGDAAVVLPGETDLSGQPRTCVGDGIPSVDIGAYQFQVACPARPAPPSGGSGQAGNPAPVPVALAPRLSGLSLSHRRFAVAGSKAPKGTPHGTVIGFRLSEAATVTITILAKRAKPGKKPKLVRLGKLTAGGVAGKNRVSFSGKLKGKPLAAGRYKLELSARSASGASSPLTAPFEIVG
jgi:hypothetical protein